MKSKRGSFSNLTLNPSLDVENSLKSLFGSNPVLICDKMVEREIERARESEGERESARGRKKRKGRKRKEKEKKRKRKKIKENDMCKNITVQKCAHTHFWIKINYCK